MDYEIIDSETGTVLGHAKSEEEANRVVGWWTVHFRRRVHHTGALVAIH